MLCLYALGDKVRMKDCFSSMLAIEIPGFTEEEEEEMNKETTYTVIIKKIFQIQNIIIRKIY